MELRPGDRIDRYTLVRPLGQGGQGSVWQVVDPLDDGALRALKIVRLADAGQAAFVRARREAKILAHLEHPCLCACHGLFEDLDKGLVGVVLDLIQGAPLDALIHDARLGKGHRYAILSQVAEALAYVHAAGLAHRDLKPGNVLVTDGFWEKPDRPGTVKLVDFGIAVPIGNPHRLTSVGGVIGTVPYLSPELFEARTRAAAEESCARDIFAFGVIAWELLFEGHPTGLGHSASFEAMAQRYRELGAGGRPWPPKSLSEPWGAAITACLALRPDDRPENGAALLEILRTGRGPARRAVVASRTETHAPASAPPSATPSSRGSSRTTEPITAPMAPLAVPEAPLPMRKSSPRSASGPMYTLAFAIVVLALAIYLKPPGKAADDEALIPLPTGISKTAPTPTAMVTIPSDRRANAAREDEPCCGGPECLAPNKNIEDSYCKTTDRTQCFQCTSGRSYVAGACGAALPRDRAFLLRLAGVDSSPRDSKICFSRGHDLSSDPVCLQRSEASDMTAPPHTVAYAKRLRVTVNDLLASNIFVKITDSRGDVIAQGKTYPQKTLKVSALCVGNVVHIGAQDTRVTFYLDDP